MKNLSTFVLGMLTAIMLAAGGGMLYIHSGSFGIAADEEHHPLMHWVMRTTRSHSIALREQHVDVRMPELAGEIPSGVVIGYEDMCAGCHAPPGRDRTALARGLNPPPPDLARSAERNAPAKLFWVTKHGIKMSGMPAWGKSHTDDELWLMVAFLQKFPGMQGDDYERLLAAAREAGAEHDHDHGDDHDH